MRLTRCPWLVGYYGTRGISRGARKLTRTPSLSKKKKKLYDILLSFPQVCHVFFLEEFSLDNHKSPDLAVDITCKFKSICIIKVDVDFVDVYKSYNLDDQFSQLNNIFI